MASKSASVEDLRDDFRHLKNLIDVIVDLTCERHAQFYPEHVGSLLWLARDFADRIVKQNEGGATNG